MEARHICGIVSSIVETLEEGVISKVVAKIDGKLFEPVAEGDTPIYSVDLKTKVEATSREELAALLGINPQDLDERIEFDGVVEFKPAPINQSLDEFED